MFFLNPHSHKKARELKSDRLLDTFIVLDRIASPGLIAVSGEKRGLGSFVCNNAEAGSGLDGYKQTLLTENHLVSPQKNFLDTSGQMAIDLPDERGRFLSVQNVHLTEFVQKALPGFTNKTQHRTVCLIPPMEDVIPHIALLLIVVNRIRDCIDAKLDPSILQATELPYPLSKKIADIKYQGSLIDSEAVQM